MQDSEKITAYLQQQLRSGLTPDEVAAQLRGAGWPEATIQQAFHQAQAQIMPTPHTAAVASPQAAQPAETVASQAQTSNQFTAPANQRGRLSTGWLLFKQSLRVLQANHSLLHYPLIGGLFSMLLFLLLGAAVLLSKHTFLIPPAHPGPNQQASVTPLGYLLIFVYYVLAYFIVNLYTAGLAANVLDLYQGKSQHYGFYMGKARGKAKTIFVFSVIEATVGMILRTIAERSRLLGRIIIRLIGAVWSIATLFVDQIIISSDDGAVPAIKHSAQLIRATWGQNLAGRVSFGVIYLLSYVLLIPVCIVLIVIGAAIGGAIGAVVAIILCLAILLAFTVVASAASSVLNTALFFYAQNKQIPAAFDAELLNSVFIPKKPGRGLFGRTS